MIDRQTEIKAMQLVTQIEETALSLYESVSLTDGDVDDVMYDLMQSVTATETPQVKAEVARMLGF